MGQTALDTIVDVAENEAKFFKKHFDQLMQGMTSIFKLKNLGDEGIKRTVIEIILLVVERIPLIIKKNHEYLKILLEMIFVEMRNIEEVIDDSWRTPPEGFSENMEDDADFETTRFGMESFNRLISSVGDKEILPQLSATVQSLLVS